MSEEKKMKIDKELISYIEWNRHSHVKSTINETLIKAVTDIGFTLLHYAAAYGNIVITRHLIELGSEVDALGRNNITPLMLAVKYGRFDIVKILFEVNANIDIVADNGTSALNLALSYDDHIFCSNLFAFKVISECRDNEELAKRLIAAGCNLHHATVFGNVELMECMLELKVDVNSKGSRDNSTALHVAARMNNLNLVSWLIEHGAKVNARDEYRRTPLLLAASNGNRDIMKILLEHGANPNRRETVSDRTPLFALFQDAGYRCGGKLFVECVELLFRYGAIPKNPVHNRPIYIPRHTLFDVALLRSEETMEMLISYVAIIKALKKGPGKSIMFCSIESYRVKMPKYKDFYKQCLRVLEIEVFEKLTILDLLQADERRLRLLARNKTFASEVKNVCDEHNLRESHGYYNKLVMDCIAKACRLVDLEDKAILVIAKMFNGNYNQCHNFVRKVNKYLNERDLENLQQLL